MIDQGAIADPLSLLGQQRQVYAATGHRPDKLGGYNPTINARLLSLARSFLEEDRPDVAISGMAQGWDQAWGWAAVELAIPLIAAVPFKGQEERWPKPARDEYHDLLARAFVYVVDDDVRGIAEVVAAMHRRNRWMVNHSTKVVALWNGSAGGTAHCVAYAGADKVVNLWDRLEMEP